MSAFAKPTGVQRKVPKHENPGPGLYNPEYRVKIKNQSTKGTFGSARKSKADHSASGPAPGQYENPLTLGRAVKKTPQSIFRSTVSRGQKLNVENPGPGAYDSEKAKIHLNQDVVSQARPSSMFSTANKTRVQSGKTKNDTLPGPGAYFINLTKKVEKTAINSSSAFKSASRRGNDFKSTKPPGPAFYRPNRVEKKSHHLNASKRWV